MVLDRVVLANALPDQPLGDSLLTEDVSLRVGDYQGSVVLVEIHGSSPGDS